MAGRASIVGAAATHVGKVRDHNEDAHYFDADLGLFVVCDGMGGHAAGEVASALAIRTIRERWESHETARQIDAWLAKGSPDAKKEMIGAIRGGVKAAHEAILAEAAADATKSGMGTTIVGGMIIGNEMIFAHAGDSRAYIVRDGIAMQLTEDHTLLARLLAAGIDVDVSGEGARFRSMLTNALGIGQDCKVSTFVVPLADGDRFLLCSDGISEYLPEAEIGTVLTTQPSPARAAQRLVDIALERGGADNATAVVVRVLEAGDNPVPAEERTREEAIVDSCVLWSARVTAQQRLRAMRIAIPREYGPDERLPAHTMGDRVAWILVEGEIELDGVLYGPGAFFYPESLIADSAPREKDALAITRSEIRVLALRADDFREVCEEDNELGEALLESLGPLVSKRRGRTTMSSSTSPTSPTSPGQLATLTPVEPGKEIIPGIPPPQPAPPPLVLEARRSPRLRDNPDAISAGMDDALRALTDDAPRITGHEDTPLPNDPQMRPVRGPGYQPRAPEPAPRDEDFESFDLSEAADPETALEMEADEPEVVEAALEMDADEPAADEQARVDFAGTLEMEADEPELALEMEADEPTTNEAPAFQVADDDRHTDTLVGGGDTVIEARPPEDTVLEKERASRVDDTVLDARAYVPPSEPPRPVAKLAIPSVKTLREPAPPEPSKPAEKPAPIPAPKPIPRIAPVLPAKLPSRTATPVAGVPVVIPPVPIAPRNIPPLSSKLPSITSSLPSSLPSSIPPPRAAVQAVAIPPAPTPVHDHEEMTVSQDDDGLPVPGDDTILTSAPPHVPRARTSEVMAAVSGSISVPETSSKPPRHEDMSIDSVPVPSENDSTSGPEISIDESTEARRAKRISEGWDE